MASDSVGSSVLYPGVARGSNLLTAPKRSTAAVMARRLHVYREGDKVKVIRGHRAGRIFTVQQTSNDWVTFKEALKRDVMSKGNIEPADGFTEEEMVVAERVLRKGG